MNDPTLHRAAARERNERRCRVCSESLLIGDQRVCQHNKNVIRVMAAPYGKSYGDTVLWPCELFSESDD